jgi:hypothetical protein
MHKRVRMNVKLISAGCALVLFLIAIPPLYLLNLLNQRHVEQQHNCDMLYSQKLPDPVQEDLCTRGLMPISISTCDGSFDVTKQNTMKIFRENISIGVDKWADVEYKFGRYRYYCDDLLVLADDPTHESYRCDYGLGDPETYEQGWPPIFVFFNKETQIVEEVRSVSCPGGS